MKKNVTTDKVTNENTGVRKFQMHKNKLNYQVIVKLQVKMLKHLNIEIDQILNIKQIQE